jgi:hypothetical protein
MPKNQNILPGSDVIGRISMYIVFKMIIIVRIKWMKRRINYFLNQFVAKKNNCIKSIRSINNQSFIKNRVYGANIKFLPPYL